MADIFISYSREDRGKAATLARALEDRRWKVWWDKEIGLGLPYDEVIERELRGSRCVVVIWTANSIGSQWVRREARAAARHEKLVPILAGDVEPPLEFGDLQTADLATWPQLDGHPEFEKVVRRIEELAPAGDGTAAPARPPVARTDRPAAPPRSPGPAPRQSRTRRSFAAMAAVVVAALAAGAVYRMTRPAPSLETKGPIRAGDPTAASPSPSGGPETSSATGTSPPPRREAAKAPASNEDGAQGQAVVANQPPPAAPPTSPKNAPREPRAKAANSAARVEPATVRTRTDFQLSIDQVDHFSSKEFEIAGLDPARDFAVVFNVKSTRRGGSTRYGIAWNFQPDDFMLFTLHSTDAGYYSIGAGRSRTHQPFARFSEGQIDINAERDFDALQMRKSGDVLMFSIDGREVWRTQDHRLLSNRFAFWAADTTDAVMSSYVVKQ